MSKISIKKNIIANYIGQFYTMFIGIFMLPFYIKYLGAEAYGLVGFFTMITSWLMLLDMGFSSALARETAKLKDKTDGLFELKLTLRSVETMVSILSIIIFISILFSAHWISEYWLQVKLLEYETVENCIILMGLMISLRWYVSLYTGLVLGFEQQVWLNTYKIFISTIKFVGGLVLIIYISDDIFHFFIYQGIVSIIELLILNYKIYSNLPKSKFVFPSIKSIKKIAPFALGLAYTSGVWIVFTQLDKLLLSHYISLDKYGYFALVVTLSAAILQFSSPISQAILPRMTSLLSNNNEKGMLSLYKKGTQYISIIIFSVVGIVSVYSYELLYAWTGDTQASVWASPILSWYALGNGVLAILTFQYYLQYAHGNLKYHIKFNTYFPLIVLPIVFFAVNNYGAIGAGIAWFIIQFVTFIIWPPYIHNKFAKGLHKDWLIKDILPAFFTTLIFLFILNVIDINFQHYSRFELFSILIGLGISLIILNAIAYQNIRRKIINFIKERNE